MLRTVKCIVLLLAAVLSVSDCKLRRNGRSPKDDDGKSSLVFVFDITGSMHNDLRQLREGAEMILNTALKEGNVIEDFVFVPFHDPAVGPATVTRSKEVFKEALNAVRVYGGGDCPEKSLTGIQLALNVSRPKSFLYVFTDATAGDHRIVSKVLDMVQRKQSQVVFILTGHCNDLHKPTYKVYQQVAAASSGQIFNLRKSSVHKMLEFVKSSVKGRTVNLASVSNPAGYNYTQEIPVDSTLGEVTVSVSGAKPKITVVDPKGEELTGPPKLVTTLDLSEIMIVKVMQPEPGNWLITVGSAEDHSVKVVGLSNLTFNHGFSVEEPKSMQETSYRPLKGTYNHMMISLTQTNVSADIQYAEILSLDGKTLFEVPLSEVDGADKVYTAQPFIPPDEFFYIAINGRDQHNQELKRMGTTAIEAKLPDVPYLTTPQKVEAHAHARVVLTCNVESLVPVAVIWTKDASRIQQQITSLQTTSLDYVIADMREEHVGTYRCAARNVAGVSKAATELAIIVDAPLVTIEPQNSTVEAGEDVTITCTVYSEALLFENKLLFNGTRTHYAIDLNKKPNMDGVYAYSKTLKINDNDTGKYSCVAANRGGKTNQSTQISIEANPTAQILGPHTISKGINSEIQLVCAVEHAHLVVWRAPDRATVRSREVNGTCNDVLEVKNVTSDGNWTCTALRGSKQGSDSVRVSVSIKPAVSIVGAKNITVLNGTVVEVTCLVVARPAPRILWHRETETFLNNTITVIKPTTYQSVLTLNSSAEPVNGTYFCFGENAEGINQDSVTVNVRRSMTLIKGFTDQTVQLYSQTELQCIVDSHPPGITHWYHNGTSLVTSDNVQINEDSTTVYLMRVDFSDLGDYKCEVENEYEKMEVKKTVSVEGLAPVMLSKEPVRLTAREGQPAIITCRVLQGHPEPTISWQYKTNESSKFSPPPKDMLVNNARYELSTPKVSEEHAGIYRCLAQNVIGEDSYDVTLVVQYPPKLLIDAKDNDKPQEVKVGDKVTLSCEATGLPPPVTEWTKDGRPLAFTDKLSSTNRSELVIETTALDIGTYTCNVTNAVGSTHRNFPVDVYDPPIILSAADPIQEVLQGQLVELPCAVEGLPAPVVEWTLNGKRIDDGKYVEEYGLRFEANLTDSGEYTCTATNDHGSTAISYSLNVWDPPKILQHTKDNDMIYDKPQEVKVGDEVTFSCEATGVPPPVTEWTKDGRPLAFTDNLSVTSGREPGLARSDLMIEAASAHDAGTYTCNVTNAVGSTRRDFNLAVYDPPKLLKDSKYNDKPQEVQVGDEVTFSCEATGLPPPVTVWTKDGRPLVFTDKLYLANASQLVVEAASPHNSGTYTCNVTSAVGSTHRNFNLSVYDPPTISSTSAPIQEVLQGQLLELPCAAEGLPAPVVEWTLNGKRIDDGKYVEEYGLRFVANLTDSGVYTCTATNEHGNTSISYTLQVWDPPKLLIDKKENDKPPKVKVGEKVTLSCEATGLPPPVTVWTKDGRPLVLTDQLKKSSKLVIDAVSVNNSGTYTCNVTSAVGATQRNFTLTVYDPPKLLKTAKDNDKPLEVQVGDKVTLSCEATGLPPPVTVWTKDGRSLVFTDNLSLTNRSELVIQAVSSYNSGTYTCNVISAVGSTHRNFTLSVYDPPTISPTADTGLEVLEGQLVELPCAAQGLPTPTVEWMLNGEPIGYKKYIDEHGLRFVANLTDFGEYTCTATNVHGNASVSYTLHVWVPPYIKPHSELLKEVLVGTNVTLQCDVIGFPLPTIEWKFNEDLLVINRTDVSFNDIGNVYISETTYKHEGVYTCVATNLAGVDQQSLFLTVTEPPKMVEDNYTGPYIATNMDTVLSVACRATGRPTPYFMWVKDEFYLNNDGRYSIDADGTLHIKSPSPDMSGNYTCIATNSVGRANKTVPVEIYTIPAYAQSEESLKTVTLEEGSDADIECPLRVTSHSIKWYKSAKLIATGPLHLRNVSRDNATTYFCVVTNAVGSAHSKVQVIVEWGPRFVAEESRDIERMSGDDCYFHCDVDAKPSAKTKWMFNSKPLVFEDESSLKIINVQRRRAGAYACVVSNVRGTVVREFTLKVLEPPFISDFDMMDVQLKEGDNATLECNAKGTPTPAVRWTFNNSNWHVENTSISAVNITSRSEGLLRCDATSPAGAAHVVYRVSVISAARVRDLVVYVGGEGSTVGHTLAVVHGSNIRVACKASGNPIPDIQWMRQGRAVSENSYDIDYADLTLRNIDTSHKGLYTCVASNEGGSDDRRITLDVLEPPKIFHTLFEATNTSEVHLEVISGQSFYLHCHPYGNPFPEVYWFKDDIPLKLFDDTMVSTDFGEVIVVKKAIEEQSGNYTCVARNTVGNTSVTYLVEVLVPPPTPKEATKSVVTNAGQQLMLACPPLGTRPSVMWIKHPYTEINAGARVSLTDDNFTLIINKTVVSDSGKYSCILINKVGTTEVTFDVVVQKRPSIAGNVGANIVEGHVVPLRRSIVLKCEVDGHPMPVITWLKDTQELSESASNIQRVLGNSLLAVWGARARDAGQYICLAENRAGTAHRRYNVAIQVPAKWSTWSEWSLCNVSCGLGHQTRSRLCQYVDDRNNTYDNSSNSETIILDQSACKGPSDDRRKCHMPPCEKDESKPRWSQWSRWSECSTTCGAGSQARTRKCKTKAKCTGDNVQIRKCADLPPCSLATGHSPSSDEFDSDDENSDSNLYIPEMTFESQPEVVDSHYSSDVEEFYSASESQSPTVFFDVEVRENLDGSVRGPCDPGFSHNISTNTCDDVDECALEHNQCHLTQVCANTAGAYRCSCSPGYLALAAGQRCLDINECELETDGCSHSCVNTAGGHVCACPRHLRLHTDRHHCVTPSLYRRPYAELESEYMGTTVDQPTKYTKAFRNK